MSDNFLHQLAEVLEQRKQAAADSSYVARLFSEGEDTILKKVGEEAVETILAAKEGDKDHLIYETADLWFHTMVLLAEKGLHPQDVLNELGRRFGISGLEEKASRNESKQEA